MNMQAPKSFQKEDRRPKVLGVTKDGVKILRPKFPPKSFTERELREAVAKALETLPAKSA
ncbi:hypothetical protein Q1W73_00850 [Asticcacaulis sp. ZE23SCel15]|uniref:hypothetical protein n=1 Tax=Asticcacaulis sp. ZE23SCel15 TaxID=3059027 RepID=UPI00265F4406|nr:hypothetical protein [Asticcacaulis sp. ZE23SCel15]WKL57566.1 hypothetical protein Q1W73_00850 [Asticcacaulis sp. ZE23SCel15]